MNGGKRPAFGYTIIEVLIVLAVSGVLFGVAATAVSGKQQKTAFRTGVYEMAARVQGIIDDVTNGKYSDIPLTCTGNPPTITTAASDQQGKNRGCVFLGKAVFFPATAKSTYQVYSVAGNRLNGSGKPATTIAEAQPTAIGALTVKEIVPQNLDVFWVEINGSDANARAFGFMQGLGQTNAAGDTYSSGADTLDMFYTPTGDPVDIVLISSAAICLTDDREYAVLTLGQDSESQLSVKTKMLGSVKPTDTAGPCA